MVPDFLSSTNFKSLKFLNYFFVQFIFVQLEIVFAIEFSWTWLSIKFIHKGSNRVSLKIWLTKLMKNSVRKTIGIAHYTCKSNILLKKYFLFIYFSLPYRKASRKTIFFDMSSKCAMSCDYLCSPYSLIRGKCAIVCHYIILVVQKKKIFIYLFIFLKKNVHMTK